MAHVSPRIKRTYNKLSFLLGIACLCSSQVHAKEYLLKLKSKQMLLQAANQVPGLKGFRLKETYQPAQLLKVDIRSKNEVDLANQLQSLYTHLDLEYVVENIQFHAFNVPSDPKLPEQWHHTTLQSSLAWDISKGTQNVVIAIIDSGVNIKHEDLKNNVFVNNKEIPKNNKDDDENGLIDDINGWDFFENDNNPDDITSAQNPGHGTHVAGIIGAVGNNQIGVTGVNQTISILPIRFLGADGSGDLMNAIKAIDYAVQMGAHVINASWGAKVQESIAKPITEAIQRARDKGVLFVAAASNDGRSNDKTDVYPANTRLDNVISVAASDSKDIKPNWSNYGQFTVHLAAPGLNIISTLPKNKYGPLSGTSMATPVVAGLAGLLKSVDIQLTPVEIRSIIQSSGSNVDIETACNCRVDSSAALSRVTHRELTLLPATAGLHIGETLQLGAYGGVGPYTFESSDPSIASISEKGELTANKDGMVTITVHDANQHTAQSRGFYINQKSENEPSNCPFDDEWLCTVLCNIDSKMPWCDNT